MALHDPKHAPGYRRLEDTLRTLKTGHNETVDFRTKTSAELAALEARLDKLPFLRPPAAT